MKIEPKKFEKETISKEKSDVKEFMIEEYKKSAHYKKKLENYKINKIMGRIKKKAKGANPLSCKKKKSYYENRDNENIITNSNKDYKDNYLEKAKNGVKLEGLVVNNVDNQEFLKKKRKRKRKDKQN